MKRPSLDQLGALVGLVQALVAVAAFVVAVIPIVQRPRVILQIDKDRTRVPPDLVARLKNVQADVNSVATDDRVPAELKEKLNKTPDQLPDDYNSDSFGSLIVDILNPTDSDAKDSRLEVKGFKTFQGVSLIGSDYNPNELAAFRDQWNQVSLQNPADGSATFSLQLPPIKSNNGHLALAIFGVNYGYTDASIVGVRADKKYLVRLIDFRGRRRYPFWFAGLSSVLFLSALVVWFQSQRIRKLTPRP